jgi:putative phosphoribosyl transferase
VFESREDAGRRLAALLRKSQQEIDLVLGLPRGGVIVAAQVAHELHRPLNVIIVRKLGHPQHREFAVGALAEPDVTILNEAALGWNPVVRAQFKAVVKEETRRLSEYRSRFHLQAAPVLKGKMVALVDDGIATGSTMEAAARGVRARGASRIIVAAPVASESAVTRLRAVADEVKVEIEDPELEAVGRYYDRFEQTTDEEVIACLRAEQVVR